MRVVVSGASGLIGSRLVPALRGAGHDVVRLVRRPSYAPDEVTWDPSARTLDTEALGRVDAAVHLAGAGVGDRRWTEAYKREILTSRVDGTTTIATALAGLEPRPAVLVSMSGIGIYGDTGEEEIDEKAPAAASFIAAVCKAWEGSADPAREAGIRVVHPRSGLVMSPGGGAFGRMLPLFRMGLGGPLGTGRQYWSWISMDDEVRALIHLIEHDELDGPVNLTGPVPVTNAEVTRALARALHRPALLPVPSPALRAVVGGFTSEVLASQRVVPRRLLDSGFTFLHGDIDAAVDSIVRPQAAARTSS